VILTHTANEGQVRIQYKCQVPIYVFQEMKLRGLVISKHNNNVLGIYKSLTYTGMYKLGTRTRSFMSGNTSIGFSLQCILGYKVKHGVLSLQDIRRRVVSSERGGGLLVTLAIHLKQNVYFGN
jgi:hypothetical protein